MGVFVEMSNKAGPIALIAIALAMVAAVFFLLREAKQGRKAVATTSSEANIGTGETTTSAPTHTRPARTSENGEPGKARPIEGDKGRVRKSSSAPLPTEGVRKVTDDGREYVEYTRADGTRVRDFRKSLRDRPLRAPKKGPRLLATKNAMSLKREIRPKVWACMREHWGELSQLPGVGENPSIMVFADTSAGSGIVTITKAEVQVQANADSEALQSCIQGALHGVEVSLLGGIEQKAYEDFEVVMQFQLPGPPTAPRRP